MTLVGDAQRFAVEYALDAAHGGKWLYGKVCFWIAGAQVGRLELGTSLRDFLLSTERLRCERGRRNNPRFATKSAQEIFELLDSALFGGGAPALDAIANDEQWARHLLKPEVDVFDRWKIFLVETSEKARVICKHDTQSAASETVLRAGECDDVLDEVCKQLGALLETA